MGGHQLRGLRLGLTGGIGSGKSSVARRLAAHGEVSRIARRLRTLRDALIAKRPLGIVERLVVDVADLLVVARHEAGWTLGRRDAQFVKIRAHPFNVLGKGLVAE